MSNRAERLAKDPPGEQKSSHRFQQRGQPSDEGREYQEHEAGGEKNGVEMGDKDNALHAASIAP